MIKIKIVENQPMASLTTFDVGGPARYSTSVRSVPDLLEALDFAKTQSAPVLVLGGGSNVLVSDGGFNGIVIRNMIKGIAGRREGDCFFVHAGSGENWQRFVDWSISENFQGLECLAGIPGTVGAAPVQNIGAYGQEVSEAIESVEAFEIDSGKPVLLSNEECRFGYRSSIFNSTQEARYFITGVTFRLKVNGKPAIVHSDLALRLKNVTDCTVKQVRDTVLAIRAGKGLLVRKGYERFRCAGSFFKNPVLVSEKYKEVEQMVERMGTFSAWSWPLGEDEIKISAAQLIQGAGFIRGYRQGNVGLSPKHTLIIIAYRKASGSEIIEFAQEVQRKVREKFGILLQPEIRLVGFPPSCLASPL